jgi:GMP synthase-like glutamine amidotransferase
MTRKPIIGVLETGRPPEELAPDHGDYLAMIVSWIGEAAAEYKVFAVLDGVLPETPRDADLWVITGSKFGSYEDHPWIPPLEGFIRACRDARRPMMGICFGHQLIAQALGGVVRKSAKGWGLGIHDYAPMNWPAELGPAPETFALQAFHQDQVEELPEGAHPIARSAFCENAALWYPGFALTVQGHPEFGKPYARALLEFRKGTVLEPTAVEVAQAGMDRGDTRADLARLIRERLLS